MRLSALLAPLAPLAVFAAFAMSPGAAHAELSDEIQVYTDDINEPGQRGLELHVNTTPRGRRVPDYPGEAVPSHGLRITPEFSWGLTRSLEAGLYLPTNRDASGRFDLAGLKLRLKWLPLKASIGEAGWFAGTNVELSRQKQRFSASRSTAELRLMGGWRNADWLLAVNPVVGWNLSPGYRSDGADLSLGLKAARSVAHEFALGLEYYVDLGTTHARLPASQQPRSLYVAADGVVGGVDLNAGIGYGLNAATDRLTLKLIVGLPF